MPTSNCPESVEQQHIHNINVCMELGGIADSNCRYTSGLSKRIESTGKTIEELTVGELLKLHRAYNEWFNQLIL